MQRRFVRAEVLRSKPCTPKQASLMISHMLQNNATLSQTDISNLERAALALREVGQSQLLGGAKQEAGSPQANGDAPDEAVFQPHEESRSKKKEEKKSKSRKRTEDANGQDTDKDAAAKSKKKKKKDKD